MIRLALMPSFVAGLAAWRDATRSRRFRNATPRLVWPCGSKNISTCRDIVGLRALEIGPGEIKEVLLGDQHRHALVVDVQEILQLGELIGRAAALDERA